MTMLKDLNRPQLIVMLTWNDYTVENAYEIFHQCKESPATCWGFKEHPLPISEMTRLYSYMKACGMKTFLEVVAYTEEEGLAGAQMAVECGCDVLMGTKFSDAVNDFCMGHGIKYMPFVGDISGRPSVLRGEVEELIHEAEECLQKGAYGIDLLGYRYIHDPVSLNSSFVKRIQAPVCLAGSIDSEERLDEVKRVNPWAFTIGSAFFEHKFGNTFLEQIEHVCEYINQ